MKKCQQQNNKKHHNKFDQKENRVIYIEKRAGQEPLLPLLCSALPPLTSTSIGIKEKTPGEEGLLCHLCLFITPS